MSGCTNTDLNGVLSTLVSLEREAREAGDRKNGLNRARNNLHDKLIDSIVDDIYEYITTKYEVEFPVVASSSGPLAVRIRSVIKFDIAQYIVDLKLAEYWDSVEPKESG